jgi:hypothetical protein
MNESNRIDVDVSAFGTGIYFAVIKTESKSLTGKIVVE